MNNDQARFKQMEKILTAVLVFAAVLFVVYLFAAGSGTIWLKALTAIITILICGLTIAYLYMTKLLLRPRTLWMTTAAAALIICLIFSLLLRFPSPL